MSMLAAGLPEGADDGLRRARAQEQRPRARTNSCTCPTPNASPLPWRRWWPRAQ
ncbi:MAG: hypothetical protein MZW92_17350 [Comamonadaceae bacterium]|nr:hypothetical protein [Comamonadaceae bacterium]